jgi:hypothetical protein
MPAPVAPPRSTISAKRGCRPVNSDEQPVDLRAVDPRVGQRLDGDAAQEVEVRLLTRVPLGRSLGDADDRGSSAKGHPVLLARSADRAAGIGRLA